MSASPFPWQRSLLVPGVELSRYATPEEDCSGLQHPVVNQARKYVRGPLHTAYEIPADNDSVDYHLPITVYRKSCEGLSTKPNSYIENAPIDFAGQTISFRDTYLGEKGFLAALPLLNQNNDWTALDASQNGLRNEAVICLVDMLLRPQHADRELFLDLSHNPISRSGALALQELVNRHSGLQWLSLRFTKVPRDLSIKLQRSLERHKELRKLLPLPARSPRRLRSVSPMASPLGSTWSRPGSALLAQISELPLYLERGDTDPPLSERLDRERSVQLLGRERSGTEPMRSLRIGRDCRSCSN
mmetsp:Transcript_81234/g.161141  ORF Transcript_81234/g.161141 Transcript_81234/m.161141 type:complete len:302 (+) Transcript_81234:27-932(+)